MLSPDKDSAYYNFFPSHDEYYGDFLVEKENSNCLPRTDYKETPTAFVFKADVPGLKKDELTVEIQDGNILCLRGQKKMKRSEVYSSGRNSEDTWHQKERTFGDKYSYFSREFKLHGNVNVDAVTVKVKDGVLIVTIPKRDGRHIRVIPISD
ncbi:hypothetical protein CCACVL1_25121 [Corchorus capsularis]|uniref:SHSP domain-containing protein n=1 Tax=Corchorus capsularis TaxID=210143 RepID=A0A1R3GLT1_COCAP|nr:hypothetical protein CCACVL1_25121 [Corchorus capsularis]